MEEEDDEPVFVVSTRPPPTRAPPLYPQLAAGGIPTNPYPNPYPQWDFAQAAEIQRKRANCTNVLNKNNQWQLRCAQPPAQPPGKPNKNKGLQIKFKSPFKPDYIPKTKMKKKKKKAKTKKVKKSKQVKRQHHKSCLLYTSPSPRDS